VQELVNNALKHASAKNVIVQISRTEGGLTLEVEDDGIGFDTEILRATSGIGWNNVKNRVEFLKGKLDVSSQTGKGTSVHIELDI
jgi:signal transduction histidine kinase